MFVSLGKDPGHSVKDLAKQLEVNRTFLARYLQALGSVKSKKIGPAKVYFNKGKNEKVMK